MSSDAFDEFLDGLDRYGGRLADWPEERRAQAAALLESSEGARAELAAMQRVEAALVRTRAASGVQTFAARAVQAPQERRQPRARVGWALAGAVALMAGFYVGSLPRHAEDPATMVAASLSGGQDVW